MRALESTRSRPAWPGPISRLARIAATLALALPALPQEPSALPQEPAALPQEPAAGRPARDANPSRSIHRRDDWALRLWPARGDAAGAPASTQRAATAIRPAFEPPPLPSGLWDDTLFDDGRAGGWVDDSVGDVIVANLFQAGQPRAPRSFGRWGSDATLFLDGRMHVTWALGAEPAPKAPAWALPSLDDALARAVLPARQEAPEAEALPESGVRVDTFSGELEGGAGGLEVDASGRVYCADFGAKLGGGPPGTRLYVLDADGEAALLVDGLRGASGNAIGPDGAFYQSNIGGGFVSRIELDGEEASGGEPRAVLDPEPVLRGLRGPVGIAIDEEGVMFIAECGGGAIVEALPDGTSSIFCSSPLLACPNGIVLDPEHNLYVANFNNGDVIRIDVAGEATRLATLPGNNNGHLTYHDGSLYVVARGAHRIFRVSLDGEVEPFAGSGERGRVDGPAAEARFSFPNDIAVAPDGKTFYVNENASTTAPHTELAPMIVRRIRVAD